MPGYSEADRQLRENRERFYRASFPALQTTTPSQRSGPYAPWAEKLGTALSVILAGGLLGLIGRPGTGKTQMAVECGKQLCRNGCSAIYIRAQEMFAIIRECYLPDALKTERQVIQRFARPGLLVIDDLQVRANSDNENRLLHWIIDTRYAVAAPTILIANNTYDEFKANLGGPLLSRMLETGGCIIAHWTDFRILKKQ